MTFPMVFLEFVLPIIQISWRRWYGLKSWNKRSSERPKWICLVAWCCSCYFHIDWCERWNWVKATATMLLLLWKLFRQWLDFLGRHSLISQYYCGMLSHGMLSISKETYMLSTSNTWNLFSNFILYLLWGHLWKPITSSRVFSALCLLYFI